MTDDLREWVVETLRSVRIVADGVPVSERHAGVLADALFSPDGKLAKELERYSEGWACPTCDVVTPELPGSGGTFTQFLCPTCGDCVRRPSSLRVERAESQLALLRDAIGEARVILSYADSDDEAAAKAYEVLGRHDAPRLLSPVPEDKK